MSRYAVYSHGGERQAAAHLLKEEAKKEREAVKKGETKKPTSGVTRMDLEPDETCCVCYDTMMKEENLTFCR